MTYWQSADVCLVILCLLYLHAWPKTLLMTLNIYERKLYLYKQQLVTLGLYAASSLFFQYVNIEIQNMWSGKNAKNIFKILIMILLHLFIFIRIEFILNHFIHRSMSNRFSKKWSFFYIYKKKNTFIKFAKILLRLSINVANILIFYFSHLLLYVLPQLKTVQNM